MTYRNWLMHLQRLGRLAICCLQAGEPGKPAGGFSLCLKVREPGEPIV